MRGARASSQHIKTQTLKTEIFAIRSCCSLRNIEQFAPQQAKGLRAKEECTDVNAVAKQ